MIEISDRLIDPGGDDYPSRCRRTVKRICGRDRDEDDEEQKERPGAPTPGREANLKIERIINHESVSCQNP